MTLGNIFTPDFWLYAANKTFRVVAIIVVAVVVQRIAALVIDRFFQARSGIKNLYFEEKRAKTLSELLKTLIRYSIYFIAVVLVLSEFHIDTTSLIAGAGVIGLALGVGAQSMIKDFISGFFIILEDQYAMGDYIVSGDLAGTVAEVGFRVTKLRDASGVLHIIPNGAITRVSNHTRGAMQATVLVPVAYDADVDQVLALLEQACTDIKSMPEVLEGPKVLGLTEFKSNEIVAKVIAKTVPMEQGKVETALRYKIRQLFTEAKIPAPVINRQTSP